MTIEDRNVHLRDTLTSHVRPRTPKEIDARAREAVGIGSGVIACMRRVPVIVLDSEEKRRLEKWVKRRIIEMTTQFLVGSSVPHDESMAGLERWTHFLEEINFRGIDIRAMKPHLDSNRSILGS